MKPMQSWQPQSRAAFIVVRNVLLVGASLGLALGAKAQDRTYTTDADFDLGVLLNVNHDAPNNDQLQLGTQSLPFPFVSVANSGNDSLVRIDAVTGQIVGEYRSAPNGEAQDPSRATVDLEGNSWMGNRAEDLAGITGSVVKVGVVVGGLRVNSSGVPDANGEYLAPPFEYITAVDRDGDGLIRTSRGLGDDLDWPAGTDGAGGAGGAALVQDALDECLLVFQKTTGVPNVRHLSIDAQNDLWAGGYNITPNRFQKLNGADGAFLGAPFDAGALGCGGFGGVIDSSGILWSVSPNQRSMLRFDTASSTASCISFTPASFTPRGVAVDSGGDVWVAGGGEVRHLDSAGNQLAQFVIPGASNLHGIAIHPGDQSILVAGFASATVYRMDSGGGNLVAIAVGAQPNGVAVDAFGKVWVSNQGSDNVMRIDDMTNTVDLTVDLGPGSQPFNPSDMTGSVAYEGTLHSGSWTVITDGGQSGTSWNNVWWSANVPDGALLAISVRAAESELGLGSLPFVPTSNGAGIAQMGRFLEVQVSFQKSSSSGQSPVLFDLTVEGQNGGDSGDCVRADRRAAGSLLLFPEYDNRAGVLTLLTVTHVDCDATGDLAVEFIYIDEQDCSEFNRTEFLTPCDTLSLLTLAHNPERERGYVYAFAKDAITGAPIAANALIGSSLILSGLEAFEYSTNPVVFQGLGAAGGTDVDGDGWLDLDGIEYSQVPDSLLIPRFLGQSSGDVKADSGGGQLRSELVMIGLTGGVEFDTTLDFLIYNDNEEVFSAEHTFHCWEKRALIEISGIFGNEFLTNWTNNHPAEILGAAGRESGWFRVDGGVASSTTTTIQDPAFYAVLIERVGGFGVADLPFELCSQEGGVLLPTTLTGE